MFKSDVLDKCMLPACVFSLPFHLGCSPHPALSSLFFLLLCAIYQLPHNLRCGCLSVVDGRGLKVFGDQLG